MSECECLDLDDEVAIFVEKMRRFGISEISIYDSGSAEVATRVEISYSMNFSKGETQ